MFEAIFQYGGPPTSSELCDYISENVLGKGPDFEEYSSEKFFILGNDAGIQEEKINEILDCLVKIFDTEFPREIIQQSLNSNYGWQITK